MIHHYTLFCIVNTPKGIPNLIIATGAMDITKTKGNNTGVPNQGTDNTIPLALTQAFNPGKDLAFSDLFFHLELNQELFVGAGILRF